MTAKEDRVNSKKEHTSLPFEVSEQTIRSSSSPAGEEGQQSFRKKRIEAFITSEKLDAVLSAIGSLKLAATYYDSKGKGKGEKHRISYGRGVGSSRMAYSDRKTIVTIVDENRVDDVITIIRSAAAGGSGTSAGIIVISPVDDVLPI
ncbi:MAG: P-II family nitrogen regulator [Thermoproteota archaeon]|nr:P-II family nitrogen regulator [Thermoproteota archaeon]